MVRFLFRPAWCLLLLANTALAIDLMDVDEAKIKRDVWDPVVKTMPTQYAGTVRLDGKPLAGVRVTDGIHFVETDENGRYTIDVKFDAMTPFLPARVLSVSWPDGTWPVKDEQTGRLLWWKRIKDVQKVPDKVDFFLKRRQIVPPFVVALGADPHGNLWDNWSYVMPQEVARAGNHVHLGMLLGDLTYADMKGADAVFPNFEKYAREFPVPFMHIQGNHDIPGPFFAAHELAGHGAFHKYLGPVRGSFDVAGVHVVLFNYWLVNRQAVEWLDAELATVPPTKPIYMFVHSWGPYLTPICEKYPNIRLVTAGHSHKTRYCGKSGNADFWTFYAYYRLLYIDGDDYEFIDRSGGENALYNYYTHQVGTPGSRKSQVAAVVLKDNSAELPGYSGIAANGSVAEADKNAPFGTSDQYDVSFTAMPTGNQPATRYGMRIVNDRGYVFTFYCDAHAKTLGLAGRGTYFDAEPVPMRAPTKHPPPDVWNAQRLIETYEQAAPGAKRSPEQIKAYNEAKAKTQGFKRLKQNLFDDWKAKFGPPTGIQFDINVCPDRIQTFVTNPVGKTRIAHIQFYKIGKAARIEYFAEDGEATFRNVQAFETGAGYHWKEFNKPAQNHLP